MPRRVVDIPRLLGSAPDSAIVLQRRHALMTEVRWLAALVAFSALLPGCATPPAQPPASPAAQQASSATPPSASSATASRTVDCGGTAGEVDPKSVEVIHPDRPVPAFHVATVGCTELHSDELIGPKPLIIVFFSSWCGVCEKKLPIVKSALEQIGDEATTFAVALDDEETWAEAEPFLKRHGIEVPLVRADRFQRFSLGYNPFRSIPVVVVVGRDGRIIDVQLGYSPFDENRLLGAVEVGKRRAPATQGPAVPVPASGAAPEPGGT